MEGVVRGDDKLATVVLEAGAKVNELTTREIVHYFSRQVVVNRT